MSSRSSAGAAKRLSLRESASAGGLPYRPSNAQFQQATLSRVRGGSALRDVYQFTAGGSDYIAKRANEHMERRELAVDHIATILGMRGADVTPVYRMERTEGDGRTLVYLVSPYVGTSDLYNAPSAAQVAAVSNAQLARTTLLEYVTGDWDRTTINYRIDAASGRVYAIDFAEAMTTRSATSAAFTVHPRSTTDHGLLQAVALTRAVPPYSVAIPRSALASFVRHSSAIFHVLQGVGASAGAVEQARRRLDYLRQLAAQPGELTYGDLAQLSANS